MLGPLRRLGLAAGLLSAALGATPAASADVRFVRTADGPVRGEAQSSVVSFKGIPYARPPVGELRWRPPMPLRRWKAVRIADHYGADCMQRPFPADAAPLRTAPSEDCLYLNVWRPARAAGARLPVMVWIHGGGFVNGGSSPAVYDGAAFARSGVILVSVNYRLGRFGYFAHPALLREAGRGPVANYGLLDQIAALRWVRRNIAAFGGDPANITVFGESAGGMSVHLLVLCPEAKGLFQKAIVESGGGRQLLGGMSDLAEAQSRGLGFAQRHGIERSTPDALKRLRALPAEAVIDGLNLASLFDARDFSGPIIDGKLVKAQVDVAYESGLAARMPMIIGSNDADGLFGGASLDDAYGPVAADRKAAEALYDPEDRREVRRIGVQVWADTFMIEPARNISRQLTSRGGEVFAYRFAYVPQAQRDELFGAPHASEIPFVFDTLGAALGERATPADRAEARLVHAQWIGFARTGRPQAPGWAAYEPAQDSLMLFDAGGAHWAADPFRRRLDLVERLYREKPVALRPGTTQDLVVANDFHGAGR